jgi:hypothetical protein
MSCSRQTTTISNGTSIEPGGGARRGGDAKIRSSEEEESEGALELWPNAELEEDELELGVASESSGMPPIELLDEGEEVELDGIPNPDDEPVLAEVNPPGRLIARDG